MKKALTGIKPTADQLHIGNYFGAVLPILQLQNHGEYDVTMFVADMHALTALHDGAMLKSNIFNIVKSYIALGIDYEKVLLFKTSDVSAHAKLNWVLGCLTSLGFMKRMHVYKDYLQKGNSDNITMGTFNYPILMAADILLYDADMVPVGKDQKQHVEFARDIAIKFNNVYGECFKIPEPLIKPQLATIPGTDGRKMSKSYNNFIGIFDSEEIVMKKVKSIVTEAIPVQDSKDPDACNIYNILKYFLDESEDVALRKMYTDGGLSFKYAKDYLYEKLIEFLKPIQEKKNSLSDELVLQILKEGADKASVISNNKVDLVYSKIGFKL